jgi:hypothetical protein
LQGAGIVYVFNLATQVWFLVLIGQPARAAGEDGA